MLQTAGIGIVDEAYCDNEFDSLEEFAKNASEGDYKGIVNYTEDAVVSQDFVSDSHTCTFDAGAGIALNDNFFKLVAWYDNEYGYSSKLIDLAVHITNL